MKEMREMGNNENKEIMVNREMKGIKNMDKGRKREKR